jgi:Concanavalin A-like lectin/glucanases superfamily
MSTNWVESIRKYSGDPLSLRFKSLAEQLAKFESHNVQVESTDQTNSIRYDNSIDNYTEISGLNQKSVFNPFYAPFEPDLITLTLWYRFEWWGKYLKDYSMITNYSTYNGSFSSRSYTTTGYTVENVWKSLPIPVDNTGVIVSPNLPITGVGPDKGYGAHLGTVAMALDGMSQNIEVSDSLSIRMTGQQVGFSVVALVSFSTFNPTSNTGQNRFVASKVDGPNNMWAIWVDNNLSDFSLAAVPEVGFTANFTPNFVTAPARPAIKYPLGHVVHFWIYRDGVNYSVVSNAAGGLLQEGMWYWIICSFDQTTSTASMFVNGVKVITTTDTPTDLLNDFQDARTSLFIGSNPASDGYFMGLISDFRYYREKVLGQFDALNLNQNMMTISYIPFGQSAIANLFVAT